jgi:hypothetical protein
MAGHLCREFCQKSAQSTTCLNCNQRDFDGRVDFCYITKKEVSLKGSCNDWEIRDE